MERKNVTRNSFDELHSSFIHTMEPFARHGIDMLLPVSVKYSLNFIIEPKTASASNDSK